MSPRKELNSFSVPLQPVWEAANLMGFPGGSDAFLSPLALTSLEQRWMGLAWWLPDGTQGDALGSACPAGPKCNLSHWGGLPGVRFVTVSGKSDTVCDSKGKEGTVLNCSFSYNGLFFSFSDPVES